MAFLWLVPSVAGATEGLVWNWNNLPATWALTAEVRLPSVLPFIAEKNSDARVSLFRVDAVVRCTNDGPIGKAKWAVTCTASDVRLAAAPLQPDAGLLPPILDEYDAIVLQHPVHLVVGDDGHVRSIDLDGVAHNDRTVVIEETLRLVMIRAFAPFDLQLPKKGDDAGRPWKQSFGFVYQFPDTQGSMGTATTDHAVASADSGVVSIVSRGRGLVGSGDMIDVGGKEQPQQLYGATLEGTARFDTVRGLLIERDYFCTMVPESSTSAINEWSAIPYIQKARLMLIEADQVAAPLPENVELPVSMGP